MLHRPSLHHLTRTAFLLAPPLAALGGMVAPPPLDTTPVPTVATADTLFSFTSADEPAWEVVNDGVMGGRSAGFVAVSDGALQFTGTLVTAGGGFTSVRARHAVDLSGLEGIELRVRGGGREFEVELDDGLRSYRRSVSRRAAFPTTAEWTVVRVPFRTLQSTVFGRRVDAPPIDLANIRGVGIYMADGQDGPFRLEVDYIRGYRAGESSTE